MSLEITAIRAQGAGGQARNKTSSAIHLRFDIRAWPRQEYYKQRLLTASHHLISDDGVIIIKAQEFRSREPPGSGYRRAGCRHKELTAEQVPSRNPSDACSKERRLSSKAQKSSVSKALAAKFVVHWIDGQNTSYDFMVRTAILSVAAACTLFALIGCNNRAGS